jgi:alpha-galactosidase
MHGGTILPIGDAPDGVAWTGFVSRTADARSVYALLFRELNASDRFTLELPGGGGEGATVTVLGGRGSATLERGRLHAIIPATRDFVWVRIDWAGKAPNAR